MAISPGNSIAPLPSPRKLRRRWLQYSVRSLLLLMLAVSLAMAFWVAPARRQRAAVIALQRQPNTEIRYDFQCREPRFQTPHNLPQWLVDCCDVNLFANVEFVRLEFHFDNELSQLATMTHVKTLFCHEVADADVDYIVELKELKELHIMGGDERLSGVKFTDIGLAKVSQLENLESLHLLGTDISDAGLVHLKKLNHLQTLDLGGTGITDAGLIQLRDMTNLKHLSLGSVPTTPRGRAALRAALPNCSISTW
jgi:hypothetical protein